MVEGGASPVSCFPFHASRLLATVWCAPASLRLQARDEDIRCGCGMPPALLRQQQRPTRTHCTLLALPTLPIAPISVSRTRAAAPIFAQLLACCAGPGLHCQDDWKWPGHLQVTTQRASAQTLWHNHGGCAGFKCGDRAGLNACTLSHVVSLSCRQLGANMGEVG